MKFSSVFLSVNEYESVWFWSLGSFTMESDVTSKNNIHHHGNLNRLCNLDLEDLKRDDFGISEPYYSGIGLRVWENWEIQANLVSDLAWNWTVYSLHVSLEYHNYTTQFGSRHVTFLLVFQGVWMIRVSCKSPSKITELSALVVAAEMHVLLVLQYQQYKECCETSFSGPPFSMVLSETWHVTWEEIICQLSAQLDSRILNLKQHGLQ